MSPAPNWHPDPTGQHELRYWDGQQWTEHVANGGVQSTSPIGAPPATDTSAQAGGQSTSGDTSADTASVDPSGSSYGASSTQDTGTAYGTGASDYAGSSYDSGSSYESSTSGGSAAASDEPYQPTSAAASADPFGSAYGANEPAYGANEPAYGADEPTTGSDSSATDVAGADSAVAGSAYSAGPAAETSSAQSSEVPGSEVPGSEVQDPATSTPATDDPYPAGAAAATTAAPQAQAQPAAGGPPVDGGITGDLIDGRYSEVDAGGVALQNNRMLRVKVTEPFMARQGSMVAYQGDVQFAYQGGGVGRFLKKAVTGEGLSLMRVEGRGDVFLADTAKHVHVLNLNSSGISVNGENVLAFSAALDWNVERVKGGSMAAGGLFNTTLRGTGWVAIVTDGEPVVLNAGEAPTFADTQAIVAWSASLETSLKSTMSAGAIVGRGSGEAIQVAFNGSGFVIVQPSEGYPVPQASS